ncbi:hypothetical protein GCM10009606_38320 [Nocardioides aquiterrae]|uniref:Calcineurin-like phosphoesterase domain-containing protein n=1 Tax=Nocardioides aquiterrae TaxID=203799 RepID=A0ABN1UN28_9ACTN
MLGVVLAGVCAGLPVSAAHDGADDRRTGTSSAPYRFVAAPDIFNQDIGDVRGQVGWQPGDPNSWTPLFAQAYDTAPDGGPRFTDRPVGTQWEDTAYAAQLSPDVLLVSLDVFHVTRAHVRTEVVGGQLAWLQRVLADARSRGVPWVIVQGHVPVLTPVRIRNSSGLTLEDGERSPLWRTLSRYGVDLYLCGEVHDTSMRQAGGVTQIASGTPIYLRKASYLTADVYADRIDLTVHEFEGVRLSAHPIWQGSSRKTQGDIAYPTASSVVGTMTLTADGRAVAATGKLAPYPG